MHTSTLRRAIETAQPIAAALATTPVPNCGLCTWHVPTYADGMPTSRFRSEHATAGGGVFRPFEEDNESWAELVVRAGRAIMEIADQHHGSTVVLVGHSETVESSFHALAAQPLHRAFDVRGGTGLDHQVDHRRPPHQLAPAECLAPTTFAAVTV